MLYACNAKADGVCCPMRCPMLYACAWVAIIFVCTDVSMHFHVCVCVCACVCVCVCVHVCTVCVCVCLFVFVCVMLFILLVFHSATSLALQVTNQIHTDV